MIANGFSPHPEKKGVLGWLGIKRNGDGAEVPLTALAAQLRAISPGSQSDIIASIAEFLSRHDLDICPHALAIAHDYITDSDPMLVRMVNERELIGQKVTIDWLRTIAGHGDYNKDAKELYRTFEKLEKHLLEFGSSATSARKAAQDYGDTLENHANALGDQQELGTSVSELLDLVRGMITHNTEMKAQMSRSEEQSAKLRNTLESALRSAEEDHLTGLPNRRAFEKQFEADYRETRAAFEELIVAFCDIDHFKRINDTHGHDAGDRVLKAVAADLASISGERCFVARHGGEEFVILFRGKSLQEARELLDQTRARLGERRMINRQTKEAIGYVTFSAGIADVADFPNHRAALKAADSALYIAKGQGRNQIVAALA